MKKQTLIFAIITSLMILPILGCGSQPEAGLEVPVAEAAPSQANDTVVVDKAIGVDDVVAPSVSETAVEFEPEEATVVEPEALQANVDAGHKAEGLPETHLVDGTNEEHLADGTYEAHHSENDADNTDTNGQYVCYHFKSRILLYSSCRKKYSGSE